MKAQAVEPEGEGSQAVLQPTGEDLQTPIRLCGAGPTLPLLPVLPSLVVPPLCQPALLAGKLKGKTLPMQSDGCQAVPCVSAGRRANIKTLKNGEMQH